MKINPNKITIKEISKRVAKDMIVKHHYSHKWTSCRYALGVYYETDNQHTFFDEVEQKLAGVAIYGYPVGRSAPKSISPELKEEEVLELTRLFIFDDYGKNTESVVLSKTFNWLKQYAKDIKVLVSYSDPEQGHLGIIYQATNWIYQGCGDFQLAPTYSLRVNEDDEWMHSRSVYSKYGSAAPKNLIKAIGQTFWLKKEASKHRYIYFLGNKKENRHFKKMMKHPIMNYPKNYQHDVEITKIEVENNKWKD